MNKNERAEDRNKQLLDIVARNRGKWLSVASIYAEVRKTPTGYRTSERTVSRLMWQLHNEGRVEHKIKIGFGSMYHASPIRLTGIRCAFKDMSKMTTYAQALADRKSASTDEEIVIAGIVEKAVEHGLTLSLEDNVCCEHSRTSNPEEMFNYLNDISDSFVANFYKGNIVHFWVHLVPGNGRDMICDYMSNPLGKEIVKHAEGALE